MSTLNSSSTLAEIEAAYADNASYCEDASVSKARAFITACRLLLLNLPAKAAFGKAESVEIETRLLAEQITEAKQWLIGRDTTNSAPRMTLASLENFRG